LFLFLFSVSVSFFRSHCPLLFPSSPRFFGSLMSSLPPSPSRPPPPLLSPPFPSPSRCGRNLKRCRRCRGNSCRTFNSYGAYASAKQG
jgi:hypothetical protein